MESVDTTPSGVSISTFFKPSARFRRMNQVYLVSDTDEGLLRAGDTAVVQGVNHAWSNRSNEPVLMVGIMTHAKPLPKEQYPAPGL